MPRDRDAHFAYVTEACVHDEHDVCGVLCRYCGEMCLCLCHYGG